MLGPVAVILVCALIWIALMLAFRAWVYPWLADGPGHDPVNTILVGTVRLYVRLVHRVTYHGMEDLRSKIDAGALVVVSNHTGAVDPLLIQAGCRFQIRWMMASEMMIGALDWLWRHQRTIPVDRDGRDSGPVRQAIRHVQTDGVIGILPEGRIVAPPREIRPFHTGIGLIVARTKAPVLLVWISGTPDTRNTVKSLTTPSRTHVRFVEVIDFAGEKDGHVITARLRQRLAEVSGWPMNDEPVPPSEDLVLVKATF
jgi:1-acyl-sn-glycerol-3-phosphate acyltransferase